MRLIDADLIQGVILSTKNQVKNHAGKVVCDCVSKLINMTPTAESDELAQQLAAYVEIGTITEVADYKRRCGLFDKICNDFLGEGDAEC